MSMHDLLTEIIKQYLKARGMQFVKLEEEIRIFMRGKPDISIAVENKKAIRDVSNESWMYVIKKCVEAGADIVIIEVKTEKITGTHIHQLYRYKMGLILSEEKQHQKICAILIGPELGKESNIRRVLFQKTGLQVNISKEGSFYVIQINSVQIYIIPFETLKPEILDNAILLLFSKDKDKAIKAAENILSKFSKTSIIYSLTLFIVPGIKMTEKDIPPENIAKAVDFIGIDRFAKALGPERLAKAIDFIGIDRFAKALGPKKLAKLFAVISEKELIEMLNQLPEEKRKILRKILANS